MRVCLVSHGFPPFERTGVENYTAALARELAAAGHSVEVFAPRHAPEWPNLAMRRDERDGYGITWLATNHPPADQEEALDLPGVAGRFGAFLDRERPELVHFQHLIKLGTGLVTEAEERRIPTVYTAHDYYPVCHRFTLIRPDMERCTTIGVPELCARCDLGLSFLNRQEGLGDYQLGVLPGQLGPEQRGALERLLAGDPEPAGFSKEELDAFIERRASLDAKRMEAYRRFDLILSPTRFLADRLTEGGIDADRIELLTYGAETELLEDVARLERDSEAPLRVGYLGGLSKHKGVHLLLDAFERVNAPCELSVWGDSSDENYVSELRERAKGLGVKWMGAYRRSELPGCLAEIDIVAVPSIWVENFPFVIREALAAGRPVIASDVGALPESVRHDVDGLLFPVGDVTELAQAIERVATEEGLLERLVAARPQIKSITDQAAELADLYRRLVASVDAESSEDLPDSLVEPLARYKTLEGLPLRELFRDVMSRMGKVRGLLEEREQPDRDPPPAVALASGSKAKILLQDLKRERDWLRGSIKSNTQALDALEERVAWREEELFQRREEVEWLRQTVEDTKRGIEASGEENSWLKGIVAGKSQEIERLHEENTWLEGVVAGKSQEIERLHEENTWLKGIVAGKSQEIERLHEEIRWLKDSLISYETDIVWYQEKRRVLEGSSETLAEENQELRAGLQQDSARLRAGLRALSRLVDLALDVREKPIGPEATDLLVEFEERPKTPSLEELSRIILTRNEQLLRLLDELSQRRHDMAEVESHARHPLTRLWLAPSGLGRRIASWSYPGEERRAEQESEDEGSQ